MKKAKLKETTLTYFKRTFDMNQPAPNLTTDMVRKIGNFLDVDFNKIAPSEYYEGLKTEMEKYGKGKGDNEITMENWVVVGGIAWKNLQKDLTFYHTEETAEGINRLKEFIRNEILGALQEANDVKIYVQKGEKPPKGKTLKKGVRGGQYFVGSPKDKKDIEKKRKTAPKTKSNIFDKPTKKPGVPRATAKAKAYANKKAQDAKKVQARTDQDNKMIKAWVEKNRHKLPMHKIDWNKVEQNYPGLTQDQRTQYGEMLLYPFHSAFSMYDLKNSFKKLSDKQLKQKPGHTDILNKRKKLGNIFNTSGFRFYGPGDGSTNASIVAPSANKKWYGKIRDMLDKEGIGNYTLDATQRPGYYLLRFE